MHRMTGALALAVVTAFLLGACQALQPQPITSLPPANAQPGDVAASYLQALVDGDCAKARALTVATNGQPFQPFCAGPRVVAFSELSQGAVANANEHDYVVAVTIRDGSSIQPNGNYSMFVQVVRTIDGAWLVTGLLNGP